MSWNYYGYRPYVSVAERARRADRALKKLKKKNPSIQPISLKSTKLANTWWGRSWNLNLERYSDYYNRIGRGRSYVRSGAILDLQIGKGEIRSLVKGSRSTPYKVSVKIKPIRRNIWDQIKDLSKKRLESLQELLQGVFPNALKDAFLVQGKGLFPSPREIQLNCSCPDWAVMCKHVAATLYGVGVRLDENPNLFFTLRGIKVEELVSHAVTEQTSKLLEKAKEKRSLRIMNESDSKLAALFNIDMEKSAKVKQPQRKKKTKSLGKRKKARVSKRKVTTGEKSGIKTKPVTANKKK